MLNSSQPPRFRGPCHPPVPVASDAALNETVLHRITCLNVGPQLVVLFGEVVGSVRGRVLLEEEFIGLPHISSSFFLLWFAVEDTISQLPVVAICHPASHAIMDFLSEILSHSKPFSFVSCFHLWYFIIATEK